MNSKNKRIITSIKAWLTILFTPFLFSCSTSLDEYKDESPTLKLDEFFNGKLKAWGTFQDYSKKVTRRFSVNMEGIWAGENGILDEHFIYDDGEKQRRVWRIEKLSDTHYLGRADDIVGVANGHSEGFALHWTYTMRLLVDGETYDVTFNDWMYLIDEENMINRAKVTKFGVTVGEVTLFIQKQPSEFN